MKILARAPARNRALNWDEYEQDYDYEHEHEQEAGRSGTRQPVP
jgi:hypothetical protein